MSDHANDRWNRCRSSGCDYARSLIIAAVSQRMWSVECTPIFLGWHRFRENNWMNAWKKKLRRISQDRFKPHKGSTNPRGEVANHRSWIVFYCVAWNIPSNRNTEINIYARSIFSGFACTMVCWTPVFCVLFQLDTLVSSSRSVRTSATGKEQYFALMFILIPFGRRRRVVIVRFGGN